MPWQRPGLRPTDPAARRDLEACCRYTHQTWGLEQAHRYIDRLTDGFTALAAAPRSAPACDHIRVGYRHRSIFVGNDVRAAVKQGQADYVPLSVARMPQLIANGRMKIDVALKIPSEGVKTAPSKLSVVEFTWRRSRRDGPVFDTVIT